MHQKIGLLPTKPVNPYQQINHPVRKSLRLLFKLLHRGAIRRTTSAPPGQKTRQG